MSETVAKQGVLLTNLGTPDAPTAAALRRYLGQFLWDHRVVDLPRPLWWLVLHGVILRFRPAKSAANYAKIWLHEGSPLSVISRQQQQRLQQRLDREQGEGRYLVVLGMRYGNPSIASALDELAQQQVESITVLPLYPQFSCSTSASTFDAIADYYRHRRSMPPMSFVNNYHSHPAYIAALARSVRDYIDQQGQPDRLLISFHGTPERYRAEGDPYFGHCQTTATLLADELGLRPSQWLLTFQSRFGREPWLQPYTDLTLERLAKEGVNHIAVICPGFAADCLETLEEIEGENRQIFIEHGGQQFGYIPALNSRPEHIALMAQLVQPCATPCRRFCGGCSN
ncbi:ferrochelatase [Ectothiorhodospiraceae bacterium BW-2]|nr:ferrochelatase [Ectothiorhodospiraceae bacterium BW-2]